MVYPITKRTIGIYFRLYVKSITGLGNLPRDRPFIIAANQSSNADAFLLLPYVVSSLDKKVYSLTRFGSEDHVDGVFSRLTLFMTKQFHLHLNL